MGQNFERKRFNPVWTRNKVLKKNKDKRKISEANKGSGFLICPN
jgi:hypothetical protein